MFGGPFWLNFSLQLAVYSFLDTSVLIFLKHYFASNLLYILLQIQQRPQQLINSQKIMSPLGVKRSCVCSNKTVTYILVILLNGNNCVIIFHSGIISYVYSRDNKVFILWNIFSIVVFMNELVLKLTFIMPIDCCQLICFKI